MHPSEIRAHLNRLLLERIEAEFAGLTSCEPYIKDLEDEISEYEGALLGAVVTQIALARAEVSGRLVG
jgi:hypothetical protein